MSILKTILISSLFHLYFCSVKSKTPNYYFKPESHPQCPEGKIYLTATGISTVSPEDSKSKAIMGVSNRIKSTVASTYEKTYVKEEDLKGISEKIKEQMNLKLSSEFDHSELIIIKSVFQEEATGKWYSFACLEKEKLRELLEKELSELKQEITRTLDHSIQAYSSVRYDLYSEDVSKIMELRNKYLPKHYELKLVGSGSEAPEINYGKMVELLAEWKEKSEVVLELQEDLPAKLKETLLTVFGEFLRNQALKFSPSGTCSRENRYCFLLKIKGVKVEERNDPATGWKIKEIKLKMFFSNPLDQKLKEDLSEITLSGATTSNVGNPDSRLVRNSLNQLLPLTKVLAKYLFVKGVK